MKQEKTEIDLELESGKYLFKYCKFDVNALQILINKTLYFNTPNNLNDPLDSRFILDIKNPDNFSDVTKEIIQESMFMQNLEIKWLLREHLLKGNLEKQKELFEKFFTHIQNTESGVCCFSKTHLNHLLWSHYADGDKGLCLVFDEAKLHESLESNLMSQKIKKYRIVHNPINYRKIPKLKITLFENGEIEYSEYHLFSKVADWEYEKEYRFVLKLNLNRISIQDTSAFNPLLGFDGECLKYIIVGSRMPETHRDMVRSLFEKGTTNSFLLKRNANYELKRI